MISLFATLQTQTMEVTDSVTAVAGTLAQPVAQAAPAAESLSFWELCVKGGFIMIPLALLLIVSIYVFIERWLAIRRADTNTPYSRLIAKGISRLGRPMNDVLVTIENTGNIEVANLGKRLPWLATTAAGAPMLGFLGTVWGMVQAFYNLAKAGTSANIDVLAGGIYQALVTTVAGLVVGIVALFAYNYLVARINGVMNSLESKTMEFMDLLNEPV